MYTTYCADFDDYCDATTDELQCLVRLREKYPNFKVTLFTIPMRTSEGTIKLAKDLGDWVQLAPHGWRHTRGECLAWTVDEAKEKIELARDFGIDAPVFRAPAWLLDGDVYEACKQLGYTVATHDTFRIPHTGALEYIYNAPRERRSAFRAVHGHMTDCGFDYIEDMFIDGKFLNFENPVFRFPQELAVRDAEVACAP